MKAIAISILVMLVFYGETSIASDSSVAYALMVRGDYAQAYREFRELAERGYPVYMNKIADMNAQGQGVEENLQKAYIWYSLSAAQGDAVGLKGKVDIESQLSHKQLESLQSQLHKYASLYLEPYKIGWMIE